MLSMENISAIQHIQSSPLQRRARAICREYDLPPESYESVLSDLASRQLREMAQPFVNLMARTEALTANLTLRADGTVERHYTESQLSVLAGCEAMISELADKVRREI
jgi:hypothetical protein